MRDLNTFVVVYGFKDFAQLSQLSIDHQVILIEPRKTTIDLVRKSLDEYVSVSLVTKFWDITASSQTLCYMDGYCTIKKSESVRTTCRRENVFTSNLETIIRKYDIHTIAHLYLNLNVDNFDNILNDVAEYNHIIKTINIHNDANMLDFDNSFLSKSFIRSPRISEYTLFEHIHLYSSKLPKICMFLTERVPDNIKHKFDMVVRHYNIEVMKNIPCGGRKVYTSLVEMLRKFYDKETQNQENCNIVVFFNPRYLLTHSFDIIYPISDEELYVNHEFDVMYASRNCFYMLFQMMSSEQFAIYLDSVTRKTPNLLKLFYRKYFYDYFQKVFALIEYPLLIERKETSV